MACDYTDGCPTCQAYLCAQSCKNDAGRNGVLPAVTEHGAHLLAECRVLRLEADRTQVQQVIAQHHSDMLALQGQGGGAGRRRAGHPGAVAQLPLRVIGRADWPTAQTWWAAT